MDRRLFLQASAGVAATSLAGPGRPAEWVSAAAAEPDEGWHVGTVTLLYSGPPGSSSIALTIDDGPHPELTPLVLDVLAERNIQATFFQTGLAAKAYPELSAAVADAGHEIGIHGWSHRNLTTLTRPEALAEILDTQALLAELTGRSPTLLRPPYGQFNETTLRDAARHRLRIALWSLSLTPLGPGRLVDSLRDGSIVLMHDGLGPDVLHPTNARALRTQARRALEIQGLASALDQVLASGLQPVTVGTLAGLAV